MAEETKPSAPTVLLGLDAADWVHDLIRLFAAALRDLNDGKPVPARWREEIEHALGKPRRGAPKSERVSARQRKVAKRVLRARLTGKPGASTREVEKLAEEYGVDPRAILRDKKQGFPVAASEEILERLKVKDAERDRQRRERGERIRERVNAGESLDQILQDAPFPEFRAIRNHQTKGLPLEGAPRPPLVTTCEERQGSIVAWILDGMNRIVDAEPVETINVYRGAALLNIRNKKKGNPRQR